MYAARAQTRLALLLTSLLLTTAALSGCDKSKSDAESTAKSTSASDQPDEQAQAGSTADTGAADDESDTSSGSEESASAESESPQTGPLKGRVSPGDVTEANPDWGKRFDGIDVEESAAQKLTEVPPGAEVTVYFGTWCPDSRREVPRLWKSLEAAGGDVPFSVEYIALDKNFEAGDVSIEGDDVQYVPTFVVKREGEEVGRIVESAPNLLEKDLLDLLSGETSGVVSGRSDL